jgi:hypothetical protein
VKDALQFVPSRNSTRLDLATTPPSLTKHNYQSNKRKHKSDSTKWTALIGFVHFSLLYLGTQLLQITFMLPSTKERGNRAGCCYPICKALFAITQDPLKGLSWSPGPQGSCESCQPLTTNGGNMPLPRNWPPCDYESYTGFLLF